MRHTLIPITLRRSLRHEYRIRASTVLLFMIATAFLIGSVFLLPSFIHASMEKSSADKVLAELNRSTNAKAETSSTADLIEKANLLKIFNDTSRGKTEYSSIITSLVGARGDISITSIEVSRTSTSSVSAIIKGIAPTREELLSLKDRLIASADGNKVDVPISLLSKVKDIPFSLSIINEKTR
ncbi:MAG: hypothetical protein WCK03_00565 [Candidatus Taylorbacteria bacterium]